MVDINTFQKLNYQFYIDFTCTVNKTAVFFFHFHTGVFTS